MNCRFLLSGSADAGQERECHNFFAERMRYYSRIPVTDVACMVAATTLQQSRVPPMSDNDGAERAPVSYYSDTANPGT